jgi:hypothetical protein
MSELEMKNNVEAKEFTDELTDEALDREPEAGGARGFTTAGTLMSSVCGPRTDR